MSSEGIKRKADFMLAEWVRTKNALDIANERIYTLETLLAEVAFNADISDESVVIRIDNKLLHAINNHLKKGVPHEV
jgi:predicted DNA binding CopG/RHH family protein